MKATKSKIEKELPMQRTNSPLESKESPPLATRGKSTTEEADLQEKMRAASKAFNDLIRAVEDAEFTTAKAYEQLRTKLWGDCLYCTPSHTVLFKLGGEWIKVTEENVAEAGKEVAEAQEVSPESYARIALQDVILWAEEAGRVGWVLPKLDKGVVA
jgi:hypothetical protein